MPSKKIIGIYGIYCLANMKMYIGQSLDIKKRWLRHKQDLNKKKHFNNYLQNSWSLYGENNFTFFILEEGDEERLNELEDKWIIKYETINNEKGFNFILNNKNRKIENSNKRKVIKSTKKILVYKDKELINIFNSIKETSEFYNFNKNRIQECCIGKRYKNGKIMKSYKGYIFLYGDHSKEELEQRYLKKPIENKQKEIKERKKRIGSHNEIKVIAKKQEEELEFRSIAEAARSLNTKERYIHRCLSGERQNHKGYIFKYKEN